MLSLAKIETSKEPSVEVDLTEVVEASIKNLSHDIDESGAKIYFDKLPCVSGDKDQLIQVFSNLIKNSIKYSGDKAPLIDISSQLHENHWVIRISDNGIGIDEDNLKNIFTIFNRSGMSIRDSLGLGLSICDRIIQKHGGTIWAESVKDEGSTFFIKFPADIKE